MPSLKNRFLVVIAGPTAAGKTSVAISLAKQFQSEIISFDSRQFYREMNIGSAKPTEEELAAVPHHFINSHSITEYYNAGKFAEDALVKLEELFEKHSVVFAVGGSGLYIQALTEGLDEMPEIPEEIRDELNKTFQNEGLEPLLNELKEKDPEYFEKVDRQNHVRIIRALEVIRSTGKPYSERRKSEPAERSFETIKIALNIPREPLYERINQRVDEMLEAGLVEEANKLHPHRGANALETVGYKELFDYFENEYDLDKAIRLIKRNSRRYAKRQLTWFRRDEEMQWFHPEEMEKMRLLIQERTGISPT